MTVIFDEWLDLEGFHLATHAWWVESLAPLFNIQKRGQDRVIPGAAGMRAHTRRTTRLSVTLVLRVFGQTDEDGVANADSRVGLYENLRAIEDAILTDVAGTRTATWHLPDGTTRTAECHVEGFTVNEGAPTEARCALELSFPAGRWTDVP